MAKLNTDKKNSEEQLELVTALSLVRVAGGWSVITYKIQGSKIVSEERTVVDVKAIAMESFKLKAVKELLNK